MPEKRPPRGRVLVVEDEAYVRESLGELLESRGFDVNLAATVEEALKCLRRVPVDVVLTDLRMPGADGLSLLRRLRDSDEEVPVLILTGQGTIASAVECMKAGATDYILKPADPDALELALVRALGTRALRREVSYLRKAGTKPIDAGHPLGECPAWQEVMATVRAAAPSNATVLLLGESGTGKELLARLIHRLSGRSGGPYVRVNCAAVPLEMWESEFFGHRRGAFTDATVDREGRFRLAHGGTLFMDEIASMAVPAQAKMLRVLQDGEFDRLGDEQSTRVDVRIVAATNSDLEADAREGRFRQDLFYRLNVLSIHLPPLRARVEDIPILAEAFVREISARLGRVPPEIDAELMEDLKAYPWPGNVRELRNALERALILDRKPVITSLHLPPLPAMAPPAPAARNASPAPAPAAAPSAPHATASGAVSGPASSVLPPAGAGQASPVSAEPPLLRDALEMREKDLVIEALRKSGGVRKEAARLLGIDQRNLGYYLNKHGIDPDRIPE
jgi:DNA-binding NtrC family response regulator